MAKKAAARAASATEVTPESQETAILTPESPAQTDEQPGEFGNGFLEETIPSQFERESVMLSCPLADPTPGSYEESQSGRFDLRLDRKRELPGFRRLHAGLQAEGAKLPDGKLVASSTDVIRWLCAELTERQNLGD